jgi:two-component system, chemotaxis family, protein-glutamate methylesterase/glutaminase
VVVVGASAGGVSALQALAEGLPADLAAAVLVVLHVSEESALPRILDRAGPLPADHARDGERLLPSRIYVAPPDRHLLVERDRVRVVRGAQENGHRPAIDPLFTSAAVSFGPNAVGVVLTGLLDDGASGAAAISRHGGTVLVQDPDEALYSSMPLSTIAADHPDAVVPAARMAAVVAETVGRMKGMPADEPGQGRNDELELELAVNGPDELGQEAPGTRSPFSCPTCGGGLWQADDDDVLRYRCRVGHAFGAESLLHAQSEGLDDALWTALRALHERADLARRVAKRMGERGLEPRVAHYRRIVEEAEQSSRVIHQLLTGRDASAA